MMNMVYKASLPTPSEIKALIPLDEKYKLVKEKNDQEVQDIILGKSKKLLLIIGPCSADNEQAVLEYISHLRKIQDKVSDVIKIVPRIYTNKPRTTGEGYKGMLHQPDPLGHPDMKKGILAIRHMHMRALVEYGFSCADEMLYPENHVFLDDLLTYVAVGARSVEDQQHRLVASGLDIPVGMKNPTGGDEVVMMNSIVASTHSHTFIYRNNEVETKGNALTHAIVRGYVDKHGVNHPNYHYEELIYICSLFDKYNLPNKALIVDCNHCNSNKNYLEQIRIALEVLESTKNNEKIFELVKGLMIESYLVDGSQKVEEGIYGKSITDPCLGIEKTEKLILDIAEFRRKQIF